MTEKASVFIILPVIFLIAPLTYMDFNTVNALLFGIPLTIYSLVILYLDMSGKTSGSSKVRGYAAYFAFLLSSLYLLAPSIIVFEKARWSFIFIWVLIAIAGLIKSDVVSDSITNGPKANKTFKLLFWGSSIVVIVLGGGGYYPASNRLAEDLGEYRELYFSTISFFFSVWILTFTQGSTAKFTKFE